MRAARIIVASLLLALIVGCQTTLAPDAARPAATKTVAKPSPADEAAYVIYVTSNGWHTGIVVASSDLPRHAIPEVDDFPMAKYLEFSWGDAEYFPAPEKGLGVVVAALFIPTPAVVHLAGLPAHPRKVYPSAEIVELRITLEQFQNLLTYLDDTFDRETTLSSSPGLYSFSRFYPASGRFHILNTCNTWTARGLKAAGVPVTVTGTLQAEALMAQLR
jgi:uncharacterized protein (TIGR02117 family)